MQLSISEYYKSRKEMIDKAIREFLEKEGLLDVSPTPLGGKRLRAVLCLLICEALGGKVDVAIDAAIAIELAHAASLDADDIVDLDVLRRGKPTTWVLKGIVKAAVGTHGLVATALRLVEKYGFEAVKVVHEAYFAMVRGEAKDVLTGGPYEAIIGAKTASLWAAASALGALAANRRDLITLARNYGFSTGMAFQIADDIVDVIKVIEKGEIHRIIQHPSSMAFLAYIGLESLLKTSPFQVLFRGIDAIKVQAKDLAMQKLDQWIRAAQGYASQFPDSQYKQLLIEYPALAVDLMFKEAGWKK